MAKRVDLAGCGAFVLAMLKEPAICRYFGWVLKVDFVRGKICVKFAKIGLRRARITAIKSGALNFRLTLRRRVVAGWLASGLRRVGRNKLFDWFR